MLPFGPLPQDKMDHQVLLLSDLGRMDTKGHSRRVGDPEGSVDQYGSSVNWCLTYNPMSRLSPLSALSENTRSVPYLYGKRNKCP